MAIVRLEVTFIFTDQSLIRYVRSIEEEYGVRLIDTRIMDIAEDMMFSNFFTTKSRETYISYIRASKMSIKRYGVPLHLVKLGKDAPAASNLGIMHRDDPNLYGSSVEHISLVIQGVDAFVKNNQKPAAFHSNHFYRHTRALLGELQAHHLEQKKEMFSTFTQFLGTEY